MGIVSIEKLKTDDYAGIKDALEKCLADIGGIADIVKPGCRVLIKPNFVAVPEQRLSGAVTRHELCRAIYEHCEKLGAKPFIAESAAVGAETEDVIFRCGYHHLREDGLELIDLKSGEYEECIINGFKSWRPVAEADVIITVPVMKTHDQTEITLGMKNLKGLVNDQEKKRFHREGVINRVCELCTALKPSLEIIDASYCQEGIGPVLGEPLYMGLLLASKDIVACEAVAGKLMGYEPEEVPITAAAARAGLGEASLNKIEIKGESMEANARHFVRADEVEIGGIPAGFELIFSEKTCTGCKNTVRSVIKAMQRDGELENLKPVRCGVGPLEAGAHCDVLIGNCAIASMRTAGENGAMKNAADACCVPGCPPHNNDVRKAISTGS